jgi:hypothetical protein
MSFLLVLALATASATAATAQPDVPAKPAPEPPRVLGPELWRGARLDMSEADIASRFPKATHSKGEVLPSGAKSALILPTTLGGAPANAQFYFQADGLVTIIIDRPDVVAHKTADNLAKAHKVADELTAEHGKPKSCSEQPKLADLTCIWVLGGAKAMLSYRDVGGAAPSLSVAYRKLNDVKPWAPAPVKKLKPR